MKAKFHIATREYSFIEPEVEGASAEDIVTQYFEFEKAYRAAVKKYKEQKEKEEEEPPFVGNEYAGSKDSPTRSDYLNKK